MKRIISLLTDFGLTDPFVAEMKAVIFSISENVQIVDISHQVEKFDISMGAFLLNRAVEYFSDGAIHVAVVDPGVGSDRREIAVETERAVFVGPDNGLMIPAARTQKILHVYELTNPSLMRKEVSATFHGRDIFAPVAAHLANGKLPRDCGPELLEYVDSPFPSAKIEGKYWISEIVHVDGFGNIVTNLSRELLKDSLLQKISLYVGGRQFSIRFVKTYSDLREGEVGALFGSHGFLELACREKSAAERLRVNRGVPVRLLRSNS
ncbi:MAG: S-adenosyl-l-methionine hydroxide adenosyltransferase family protein [Candidatus Bathyarchaeia archaeon]